MIIINDLNIRKQARELGVDIWHTPSFLFLMMGFIIIVAMTATYFISRNYDSPEVLIISECLVVVTIFTLGNSVIRSVEQIARINKMKSEFISVASHQLRTPLSAMKWETELLMSKYRKGLSDKHLRSLETVSSLSARMTKIVNDLLDVARIEQGRLPLKRQSIDINSITQEVIKNFFNLAKAKNISIIFKEKKSPLALGDPEKIKLVVENIIGNAIKYICDRGKIEIRVHSSGGFVVFTAKDNGVGIPLSQQCQIFKKFFRSDNAVKYQTEGSGLGLYIAKNIVEQLGGKIWFKSRENVGTMFAFSLPIASKKIN